jgi:hypothetical protein
LIEATGAILRPPVDRARILGADGDPGRDAAVVRLCDPCPLDCAGGGQAREFLLRCDVPGPSGLPRFRFPRDSSPPMPRCER